MKFKRQSYRCLVCDWTETTHKNRDGIQCPSCNGPVVPFYAESKTIDKPTMIPKPPEGWRDKVDGNDELIGYILRRLESDRGVTLSYKTVRDVLVLRSLYNEQEVKPDATV